jgi:integrase
MALTIKRVARLCKRPGRYHDKDGLYLQVGTRGASWLFRYQQHHRERWAGLGSLKSVDLESARRKARAARELLYAGKDPIAEKRAARAVAFESHAAASAAATTFRASATLYAAGREHEGKGTRYDGAFLRSMNHYVLPIIGALPVSAIDTAAVLRVLEQPVEEKRGRYPAGPFWAARPVTADRVRARIEAVLDWARVRELRSGDNPARWRGHLDHALGEKKRKLVKHHAAMAYAEVGAFVRRLHEREGVAPRALEFLILTACRTGEVLNATWDEFDLRAGEWMIPAARMKAGKEHRVPLSPRAIQILRELPTEEGNGYVFIGTTAGARLSDMALGKLLARMKVQGITVHGFRSGFRTWAAESTRVENHVAEAALAHVVGNAVERAYHRTDLFAKRRKLMEAWAQYLERPAAEGEVIELGARREKAAR